MTTDPDKPAPAAPARTTEDAFDLALAKVLNSHLRMERRGKSDVHAAKAKEAVDEIFDLFRRAIAPRDDRLPRPTGQEFVDALTDLLDNCATAHSDQSSSEAIKAALAEQTSKYAKVLDLFRRARGDEGAKP